MLAFFRKVYYNILWYKIETKLVGYWKGIEYENCRDT